MDLGIEFMTYFIDSPIKKTFWNRLLSTENPENARKKRNHLPVFNKGSRGRIVLTIDMVLIDIESWNFESLHKSMNVILFS